ncbi:4,5-DOPA dioxygenase extradiol [Glaciimonas sp. PAMC28666]|nr:4,5-DOPA dioxygenase extradiol [Glaciimonas sp. PAMC28666]
MPAIFFGHGSPMNALQDNRYTQAWEQLGASVAALKPRAILSISAHWYIRGTSVTAMPMPKTIHDFGGFPQALFDVQYPAAGDPALAAQVRDLLAPMSVEMDHSWGLDHGTWSVLVKAFPKADVPVIQLSIDATQPPEFHFELGRKLASLREQGVLIIGSGDVVHNLRLANWDPQAPARDWAMRFNSSIGASLLAGDLQKVTDYAALGEDGKLSVPTAEHFLPLLYVIGTRQDDEAISIPIDGIDMGAISMMSVVVGAVRK